MRVQVVVGSVREGRRSLPVARWAADELGQMDLGTVELVDLAEWALPFLAFARPPAMGRYQDPLQQRWAAKVAEADGYVFVAPEYNHGYPAALKNALDFVFAEWARKPAAFVSFGNVGGARCVEQLRLVAVELHMAPIASAVHVFDVVAKLKDGVFTPAERDRAQLERMAGELRWWGEALRAARGG